MIEYKVKLSLSHTCGESLIEIWKKMDYMRYKMVCGAWNSVFRGRVRRFGILVLIMLTNGHTFLAKKRKRKKAFMTDKLSF